MIEELLLTQLASERDHVLHAVDGGKCTVTVAPVSSTTVHPV